MKRKQKVMTPAQALTASVGEETNEEISKMRRVGKRVERKRVSFDLRTDLHKELKMQSLIQEKNIYILIEEALENYLKETKE